MEMSTNPTIPSHNEIEKYYARNEWRGFLEVIITLSLYLFSLSGMYLAYQINWLLSIPFIFMNGFSIVRLFIVQHDCSHYSLFTKISLNIYVGRFLSLFTLTPYFNWRWQHLIHHGASGNLDKRGIGDVPMLTVEEYQNSTTLNKIIYHIHRNLLLLTFVLSPIYFLIILRSPHLFFSEYKKHYLFSKQVINSAYLTNVFLILFYSPFIYFFGIHFILSCYLFSLIFSSACLALGFYGQHNFPETYFTDKENWNYVDAGFKGSSQYALPRWLDWTIYFIGYHSIHHLYPKVPGYNLKKCFADHKVFANTATYELKDIYLLSTQKLYDVRAQRLISWKEYRNLSLNKEVAH